MVGFYATSEQVEPFTSTVMTMAAAVATRLTSAVFSFTKGLWGTEDTNATLQQHTDHASLGEEDALVMEPASSIPLLRYLEDARRCILSIHMAPPEAHAAQQLALLTDAFGRVLLLDMEAMVLIRMWKGYREAQCAFLQVHDQRRRRRRLCVVIYAEKRGLLEIWRSRHGPRLDAFQVGRHGQLMTSPAASLCKHCQVPSDSDMENPAPMLQSHASEVYFLHGNGMLDRIQVPTDQVNKAFT